MWGAAAWRERYRHRERHERHGENGRRRRACQRHEDERKQQQARQRKYCRRRRELQNESSEERNENIMPPSKAMERQIVSVIASGESHPSMLIMGSSASATMWILVRFYLVEDFTVLVLLSFLTTRIRSWPERTHYRRRRTPLR